MDQLKAYPDWADTPDERQTYDADFRALLDQFEQDVLARSNVLADLLITPIYDLDDRVHHVNAQIVTWKAGQTYGSVVTVWAGADAETRAHSLDQWGRALEMLDALHKED